MVVQKGECPPEVTFGVATAVVIVELSPPTRPPVAAGTAHRSVDWHT
jgi:hypothetical protein